MDGGSVTTTTNVRVLVRSFIFWNDLGMDAFVHSPAGAKDNQPILNDAMVADHEKRFTNAAQNLINQGFLPPNIADTVTNELSVTILPSGEFVVTPSVAFYIGALTLKGGLFSSLQTQSFSLLVLLCQLSKGRN
jgi:hypothetical protein